MTRKATALLALVALCGLLPAAAQDAPQQAEEAMEKAAEIAGQAEQVMEQAGEMVEEAAELDMTLDEVLESYYEAVGGKQAWMDVEAIRFNGKMAMGPGMEAPFTMTMKRPGKIRLEFTIQGMTGVQASDGETAWMVMPFMGRTDPEEMPADMAKQLEEQADIEGDLFDYETKGHQVELIGKEEVEGTEVYKLKVVRANGEERYHFLDAEYFIPIRQEAKTTIQGNEMEIEVAVGDYKEVEGLMIPHSIENKPKGAPQGQVITIESVEVNPEGLADDLFMMPEVAEEAEEAEAAE